MALCRVELETFMLQLVRRRGVLQLHFHQLDCLDR